MHDDRDHIRTVIRALRAQLGSEGPVCPDTFARLRWSMTGDLLRHMAAERLHLTRGDGAPELRERCDTDERTFRDHVARWPACAMQMHWLVYRSEFVALLRSIEARLQAEQARELSAIASRPRAAVSARAVSA